MNLSLSTTSSFIQQIQSLLNIIDLNHFVQLFQLAINGNTTQQQSKVFIMLKQIQSKPQSYLYFLYIFINPQYQQHIRYITGTTMKSSLQRNSKQIHFQQKHKLLMKQTLLSQSITSPKLKSLQYILISQLSICFQQVDWQLIYYLVNSINQSNIQVLTLLYTIFEDLKHHRQNYSYFQGAIQTQVIQSLFKKVHQLICVTLNNTNFYNLKQFNQQIKALTQSFKLIRIITFHLPLKLSQYLITYINQCITPLVKTLSTLLSKQQISQFIKHSHHLPHGNNVKQMIIQLFQSINQISQTKSQYILSNTQFLDQFILYFPINCQQFRHHYTQAIKIWTNIILQLLINDQAHYQNQQEQEINHNNQNTKLQNYIQVIISRVLVGFRFTKQDEQHILHQMELQHNPYNIQQALNNKQNQQHSQDQQNNFQTSHGKAHGSTLRKVSITCIEKLSLYYSQILWEMNKPIIYQLLKNQNDYKAQQSGIIFIGIIAQNCLKDIKPDIIPIMQLLSNIQNKLKHDITLASTLWTFQKLIQAYSGSSQTKKFVYELIYKVMTNKQEYSHLINCKNFMVKQAAVSLLDQLLSQQAQVETQIIKTMLQCLMYTLQTFTGRALFNAFKAISTIFQLPQRQGIQSLLVSTTIKYLCVKWGNSVQKDSIMCPLIECLSYICQDRRKYVVEYSLQILTQIYPLFKQTERKSLVLRVIDLATAIIVGAKQQPQSQAYKKIKIIVSSQQFLGTVNNLILSEQKQIRHFGYGLLSDIIKLNGVSNEKSDQFVQIIAKTMDKSNSTSINNALMCITDIIDYHRVIGAKYCKQILHVIVDFIQKFPSANLPKIYLLNFARMFGRLSHVDIVSAKELMINKRGLLKLLCQGLRSQQKSQLTLSAYSGITLLMNSLSQVELTYLMQLKQMEWYLDSFMGYKHNIECKQNMSEMVILLNKMKGLLLQRKIQWNKYLNSTMLFPATIGRICQLVN